MACLDNKGVRANAGRAAAAHALFVMARLASTFIIQLSQEQQSRSPGAKKSGPIVTDSAGSSISTSFANCFL
jgi:hypothetical protein